MNFNFEANLRNQRKAVLYFKNNIDSNSIKSFSHRENFYWFTFHWKIAKYMSMHSRLGIYLHWGKLLSLHTVIVSILSNCSAILFVCSFISNSPLLLFLYCRILSSFLVQQLHWWTKETENLKTIALHRKWRLKRKLVKW